MKTELDWSAYEDAGQGDPYADIPRCGGNFAKAVAACINSKQCEVSNNGVMCPSFKITGNPHLSTGGRVRLLKRALSSESASLAQAALADPELAQAMDSCVACKGCKRECESNVDMALIKSEYKAQLRSCASLKPRWGVRLRNALFAHTPRWLHRLGALRFFLSVSNQSPLIANWGARLLGLSATMPLPVPSRRKLSQLDPVSAPAIRSNTRLVLWADTFHRYFEPKVGQDAARVLSAAGYEVELLQAPKGERPPCCGRTYLAQGRIEDARFELRRFVSMALPHIREGKILVGLEASCVLGLRDDALAMGLGAEVRELAPRVMMLEEFLSKEAVKGKLDLPLRSPPSARKSLIHGHCHQKAAGALKAMRRVLKLIPNHDFEIIRSSCCGMAGTFGLEKEHQEFSTQMAEEALLPAIRAAPHAQVVTNGFSCRHQIHRHGFEKPVHLASLLADCLDK